MSVSAGRGSRWKWVRLGIALLLVLGLAWVGRASGVLSDLSMDGVRAQVMGAGSWGVLVFLGLFCLGQLLHVPGLLFVGAGLLIYGAWAGLILGMVGALCSVTVSFYVVRLTGGAALAELQSPWAKKLLARLDARPITTVCLLRLVLWLSPPLNYALALTKVRFHAYLLGSAVGLAPVLVGMALLLSIGGRSWTLTP